MKQYLYRVEAQAKYSINPMLGCQTISGYEPVMDTYLIDRVTPKGYRLMCGKWVSATARKRYAYPTKDEAVVAYKHRKSAYVRYAKANYEKALAQYNCVDQVNAESIKTQAADCFF